MFEAPGNYICINCGKPVKDLYKKYSATVLKLTECGYCKNIADKYLEYDNVIIIIDLILLRIMAYRHILLNSRFRNFWKLSIVLLLLETYSNWSINTPNISNKTNINETEPYLNEPDIYLEDIKFYLLYIDVTVCTIFHLVILYVFTFIYVLVQRQARISLVMIGKMVTLSSTGTFLFLPSLIWDINAYNFHLHFITIYSTLSQLIAYKALCNSEKSWTLVIIMSAILMKIYIKNSLNSIVLIKYLLPD